MKLNEKGRLSLSKIPIFGLSPNLVEAQVKSFKWFKDEGLQKIFEEISPIDDYTGESWTVEFGKIRFGKPNVAFHEAQKLGLSYDAPVYVNTRLINKKTGEVKEQELFIADVPIMNERGTFVINGNERVVVMQIVRAEGVIFLESKQSTIEKPLYSVKLMPERGHWFEFEVNKYDVMSVKLIEKRPKILLTTLLRALGYATDDEIRKLFKDVKAPEDKNILESTLLKDTTSSTEEALIEIYRKIRPEDSITLDTAKSLIEGVFFNERRFFLGKVGRYQLNKKLGTKLAMQEENYVLFKEDVVQVIRALLQLNYGQILPDDVDHLANRRIRGVGELIANKVRVGLLRLEKNIKDRMSTFGSEETLTPSILVNTRPVGASFTEFFGSSAVSRYMDQENILSELEHKRRITASGPGGLTKERATFSVRDVHSSQYARLCPVSTPEGPLIGIVGHMSIYAKINDYGFIEAPYRKVLHEVDASRGTRTKLIGRVLDEAVKEISGTKKGQKIDEKLADRLIKAKVGKVKVFPYLTEEVEYFVADEEMKHKIAPATADIDADGNIVSQLIFVRTGGNFRNVPASEVDYIDVNPSQIAGLGLALIPFANNDDPTRTLMGSNMQRQAVPLVNPSVPIVGTGYEEVAAKASGRGVYAAHDGEITKVDAQVIEVTFKAGRKNKKDVYRLEKFIRSNQNTSFNQVARVDIGDKVKEGNLLADGAAMDNGELALGQNVRAAYMIYEGYNYEDAIVISERLVKDDIFTSVHVKEYVQDIRETKLGPELITRDIPNVSEYTLRNLDEHGIVRVGASVEPQDILVGIIAPKGETELTAEEKLLRSIFGDYARDVRDNSLRLPHGDGGIVVDVQVLDKEKGDRLSSSGTLKQVKVWVARTHKIGIGDKLTGRHGDKGVIAKVLQEEDMPYTADGRPVDIVLTPLFVKRMNVGQLKEVHLGRIAERLGIKLEVPVCAPIDEDQLYVLAKEKGINFDQKEILYDGRTGKPFDQKVTVGPRYIVKLNHLADDKVHARSTGAYTMVTQQPLGGRSMMGGQRFGEMEVWALEAHAVPHVLQEMLTIKSDDVVGRAEAYKSVIQGQPIKAPSIPESFKVLVSELRAMGLSLDMIEPERGKRSSAKEESQNDIDEEVEPLERTQRVNGEGK